MREFTAKTADTCHRRDNGGIGRVNSQLATEIWETIPGKPKGCDFAIDLNAPINPLLA